MKTGTLFIDHFGQQCKIIGIDNNPKNKPIKAINVKTGKKCFYHYKQVKL